MPSLRRSVWEADQPSASPSTSPTPPAEDRWGTMPPSAPDHGPTFPVRPGTMLDRISIATPRPEPTRSRSWEKQHPSMTYRKVPTEIRDAVTQVADDTGYTASQIAQVFLEYALYGFRRGDFQLEVGLGPRGTTLFRGGGEARKPAWVENTSWGRTPPKKKPRKKKTASLREQRITYRLSPALVSEIEQVCQRQVYDEARPEYMYQIGEVMARFLAFSLTAYQDGTLILQGNDDE